MNFLLFEVFHCLWIQTLPLWIQGNIFYYYELKGHIVKYYGLKTYGFQAMITNFINPKFLNLCFLDSSLKCFIPSNSCSINLVELPMPLH